jgi:ribonuclease BN (tRNA processing enzyme)
MQIRGSSTAQIATWLHVPDRRLLIDAGDGAAACLGRRCKDIDTVAITHQHRDHIAGLLEVLSWSAYDRPCRVVYPAGSDFVEGIRDGAARQGVPCASEARWVPVTPGQEVALGGDDLDGAPADHTAPRLRAFAASHAVQKHRDRAVGYALVEDHHVRLAVTGDCGTDPPVLPGRPDVLVRDCTYLRSTDIGEWGDALRQHGLLEPVLDQAAIAPPQTLVLYHLDARYSPHDAAWIREACRARSLPCTVSVFWPHAAEEDVIGCPLWTPRRAGS